MIPYFLLLLIPLTIQSSLKHFNKAICIGGSKRKATADNIALPSFFILFVVLLALRDETVGRDLSNYKIIFNAIGNGVLFETYYGISEPVFQIYNWFIYNYISTNFQVFIAITAVVTVLPIAYVYCKEKNNGYIKIALFVNMSTFIMLFSGIRQAIAMAAGILAYQFLKDKKTSKFIIFALLATFTHHTGFMIFFLYPLLRMRFQKRDLLWIVPISCLVIAFNRPIFNSLAGLISGSDDKYNVAAGYTGAVGSFLLFLLFTIFSYTICDETKMDDEAFGLRNILVFATIVQSFASLNPLAMRMNYYFILLIPIAVGTSINCSSDKYKQVAKVSEIVICVFFTLLFFINTYNSYITGLSSLDTVPYIPFWKG